MITQPNDFNCALVYRALVAGSLREALRTAAKQLDRGREKIKFTARVDLTRRLHAFSLNSSIVQILKDSVNTGSYLNPAEQSETKEP